jgi:hypothetical protein
MLRKIVFILTLLCSLAVANSAMGFSWNDCTVWHNTDGDQNWFNVNDWVHNGVTAPAVNNGTIPPDGNTWANIEPYPGPRIDGDAVCAQLTVCQWSWAGAPDMAVEVNSGTLVAGETIGLSTGDNFAYSLVDPNGLPLNVPGSAGLTVRGGTVTTPLAPAGGGGLVIGGGSGYSLSNVGRVKMYGGLISVPRIALRNGDIALYGGTLECTGTYDVNFTFFQGWPNNKIDISGGTLKLAGDATAALNTLIGNGRIYSSRSVLGTPDFNATRGTTTLTSPAGDLKLAWNPSPAKGAANVHYKHSTDPCYITLSWNAGEPNVTTHNVYFGTSFADVNIAKDVNTQYKGTRVEANEPRTWDINDVNFALNTTYYWRVDENSVTAYNDDGSPKTFLMTKGTVWSFTTHDGKAYNPKPYNGAATLNEPLQLSWSAGDWTASTMGHKVYFTTAAGGGNLANPSFPRPTDSQYRGTQTGTSYSLANLAGSFTLAPGTTYWWCVDEVINGVTVKTDKVWSFTPATSVIVDNFEDYNSTADMNANWTTGFATCSGYPNTLGTVKYVQDNTQSLAPAGKHMIVHYDNSGAAGDSYTEVTRSYSPATSFTGNGFFNPNTAAVSIDYIGSLANAANPDYDRMFIRIADTAGHFGIKLNDDASAAKVTTWTSWFVALNDGNFAGVNMADVCSFSVGFGNDRVGCVRNAAGGDGNVMFDNIKLWAKTCNPGFAKTTGGLTADLDGDCDVDINDLDVFANSWLWAAIPTHSIPYTTPRKAPVIWYKLNESDGTTVADSASGYTADIGGVAIFDPTGGRKGDACITFNTLASQNTCLVVRDPNTAFGFMKDDAHHNNDSNGGSVSFSVWINADTTVGDVVTNNWASLFCVHDGTVGNDNGIAWLSLPSSFANPNVNFQGTGANVYGPTMPINNFGGKWNHWVAVKQEPNLMVVYCNGREIGRTQSLAAEVPFFKLPITSFRIGLRGGEAYANWGKFPGKMQDFKVWDYALDANEVGYEATDGTGVVAPTPLVTNANLNLSGGTADDENQTVNFADLSIMCDQWRKQVLWP